MFSIKVLSRSDLVKLHQYREKGGTYEYDVTQHRSSGQRPVKLCLIVQTTKYFHFYLELYKDELQEFDSDQ
jgi:hypothetical protein